MKTRMKIKKGDTVHCSPARTAASRAASSRRVRRETVLVENLNMVKRHSRPKPIKNPSRMGGTQFTPGGVIEQRGADPDLERDARLPDVQTGRPGSAYLTKERKDERPQGAGLQARRLRPGDRQVMATANET